METEFRVIGQVKSLIDNKPATIKMAIEIRFLDLSLDKKKTTFNSVR